MSLSDGILGAREVLDELGFSWCVVCGLAVAAHVPARFTRDVDLAVSVTDDADAEVAVRRFVSRGWRLTEVHEQEATGRLASVRLRSPRDAVVDLIFASTGIEAETVGDAEAIELLPDLMAPTATRAHLIAMKLLSVDESRPRDAQDLRDLLVGAGQDQLLRTRELLRLMVERSTHRGRELEARLDGLLA